MRPAGQETLAYVDRCPHRAAALSEGRMTASGHLQCAYHGWTFGRDGSCLNIPQVRCIMWLLLLMCTGLSSL